MLPDCLSTKKTATVCSVFWLPCLPCENKVNESIRMNKNQIHPHPSPSSPQPSPKEREKERRGRKKGEGAITKKICG
jgi:hypothetical protein